MSDKIMNPDTGRLVYKSGKIGQQILNSKKRANKKITKILALCHNSYDKNKHAILNTFVKKYINVEFTFVDIRGKETNSNFVKGDLMKKTTWDELMVKGPFKIVVDMMCSDGSHKGIAKYAHKVIKPGGELYWVKDTYGNLWRQFEHVVVNSKSKKEVKLEYHVGYTEDSDSESEEEDLRFTYIVYKF